MKTMKTTTTRATRSLSSVLSRNRAVEKKNTSSSSSESEQKKNRPRSSRKRKSGRSATKRTLSYPLFIVLNSLSLSYTYKCTSFTL